MDHHLTRDACPVLACRFFVGPTLTALVKDSLWIAATAGCYGPGVKKEDEDDNLRTGLLKALVVPAAVALIGFVIWYVTAK
jgi:hypothetical protein